MNWIHYDALCFSTLCTHHKQIQLKDKIQDSSAKIEVALISLRSNGSRRTLQFTTRMDHG